MIAPIPIWRSERFGDIASGPIPGSVDVAVVGAGIIGSSAMHHLVMSGVDAVLIEAGRAGYGSSTTGAGVVGWSRSLARPTEIDPRASGYVGLTEAVDTAQDWLAAHIASHDLDAELTIPGSVRISGPSDPGILGTVDPGMLIHALVTAVAAAGGPVASDEPIRSISRRTGGFQLLTSRRKISARSVILATGAAGGPYPMGEIRNRYRVRRGRCVILNADSGVLDDVVPPGATVYTPSSDVVVTRRIGASAALVWYPRLTRRKAGLAPAALIAATVPALRHGAVTHDWQDAYAATHDGLPRIGRVNAVWYAGGAADPALGAVLGHHVAGLTIGTTGSSPFAEIPHTHALTQQLRARIGGFSA